MEISLPMLPSGISLNSHVHWAKRKPPRTQPTSRLPSTGLFLSGPSIGAICSFGSTCPAAATGI